MQEEEKKDTTTSVKVHHAPGGQSNFSLGWGDESSTQQQQRAKP